MFVLASLLNLPRHRERLDELDAKEARAREWATT
jgi:hypothetical protein